MRQNMVKTSVIYSSESRACATLLFLPLWSIIEQMLGNTESICYRYYKARWLLQIATVHTLLPFIKVLQLKRGDVIFHSVSQPYMVIISPTAATRTSQARVNMGDLKPYALPREGGGDTPCDS